MGIHINGVNMEQENKKDYEFVTETIKKKPVNKKKVFYKGLHSICFGIIAGIAASLVFVVIEPMLYQKLHPQVNDYVSIPEDDDLALTEAEHESDASQQESSDASTGTVLGEDEAAPITVNPIDEDDSDNHDTDTSDDGHEESVSEGNEEGANKPDNDGNDSEPVSNEENDKDKDNQDANTAEHTDENAEEETADTEKVTSVVTKEITLDDYKVLYRQMSEVANIAKRSLTTVKSVTKSTDWFKNSYELGKTSTGMIIADNGKELLIITKGDSLKINEEVDVTFCDKKTYSGTVKKTDLDTGLSVVAVILEDIEDVTKNSYAPAELGNSTVPTLVGTPIMAIGSPLGIEDSMASGLVTSNNHVLELTDCNVRYITTDIYSSTNGSGVIINLEGKVMGIMFQGGTSTDTKNLLHAYSISDIKSTIEKLVNGQDVAYLGIKGTDVTKEAMEEFSVPEGAFVTQVVLDSPAMKAGIQNGDVIVKLGTSDIKTFKDYRDAISKCQPGDTAVVTVKRLVKDGYTEFSYEIYLEALK